MKIRLPRIKAVVIIPIVVIAVWSLFSPPVYLNYNINFANKYLNSRFEKDQKIMKEFAVQGVKATIQGTQYYNGNLLIYNTQGTRTPYQGSGYYPGDVMLFNSIANFSTYTPSGNSLGEAYAKVTFYDFLTQGQYGFSLDMGINL